MDVDIDIEDDLFERAMRFAPQGTSVDQLVELALSAFIECRIARQKVESEAALKRDE